jgi:hypothetical protein
VRPFRTPNAERPTGCAPLAHFDGDPEEKEADKQRYHLITFFGTAGF